MARVLCWGAPSAIILASAVSLERTSLRVPWTSRSPSVIPTVKVHDKSVYGQYLCAIYDSQTRLDHYYVAKRLLKIKPNQRLPDRGPTSFLVAGRLPIGDYEIGCRNCSQFKRRA